MVLKQQGYEDKRELNDRYWQESLSENAVHLDGSFLKNEGQKTDQGHLRKGGTLTYVTASQYHCNRL